MNIAFPFQFDSRGRTSTSDDGIRDLIEQLIFTNPGERVNRPDFGSGLAQLIFGANSPEQVTALKLTLQAALQRWLGDLIEVQSLDLANEDASLHISIQYVVRRTNTRQKASFQREN